MSAFQDFGHLSERRRAEKQRKLRKRLAIAGISTFIFLIIIAAVVFTVVSRSKHDKKEHDDVPVVRQMSQSSKAIKMLCSPTDYKEVCMSSLSKVVGSNSSTPQTKDLIKASVSVIIDEVGKAFEHSSMFKSDDPKIKGAIEDCKELFHYAQDELNSTLFAVDAHNVGTLTTKSHDLKNWLSAVISYQQTCIDGFPDGELKSKMQEGMKTGKQLTSNALAIITEAASLLSMLKVPGFKLGRRLFAEEAKGGLPNWVSREDRRVLKGMAKKLTPNVVVAKDGSGKFKTISDALAAMPETYTGRYIIYVKAGLYEETVMVTKKMVNVTMYGDGSRKSIVTGSKNFVDGTRTFQTATVAVIGDGFMAIGMGFRNTAGPEKHQAVALRVQSDRSIFLNCRMEGYQDTLYVQTHRQFYRSCVITGTVDFIFGDAASVFQNCMIVLRKPLDNQQNIITAQGRIDRHETTGIVIQNCRILADKKLVPVKLKIKSYLARPWKEYSRTIFMESTICDFIQPEGYLPWEGEFALKTLFYAEYNNKGPGSTLSARVKWPGYKGAISKAEAQQYTVANFIQGGDWLKATNTPVHLGLFV